MDDNFLVSPGDNELLVVEFVLTASILFYTVVLSVGK